jgi:hypothetical protein
LVPTALAHAHRSGKTVKQPIVLPLVATAKGVGDPPHQVQKQEKP